MLLCVGLLFAHAVVAQKVSWTVDGRLKGAEHPNRNGNVSFEVEADLNAELPYKETVRLITQRIDATIANLEDSSQAFVGFYGRLWEDIDRNIRLEVVADLKKISEWLKSDYQVNEVEPTVRQLTKLRTALSGFRKAKTDNWYLLNDLPLGDKVGLTGDDIDKAKHAYVIKLSRQHLVNKLYMDLYTSTTSDKAFGDMLTSDLASQLAHLSSLLARSTAYLKKGVNDMTLADSADFRQVTHDMEDNKVYVAASQSDFFKNWVWWRAGEPTINPYEVRGTDTLAANGGSKLLSGVQNVSKIKEMSVKDEQLNKVLLPIADKKEARYIQFFRTQDVSDDDIKSLKRHLKGTEYIQLTVHNVAANERVEVKLSSSATHNGMNESVAMLDSFFSTLTGVLGLMSGAPNDLWKTAIPNIQALKSSAGMIAYARTKAIAAPRNADGILAAVKQSLADSSIYNKALFDRLANDRKPQLQAIVAGGNLTSLEDFLKNFVSKYQEQYQSWANVRERLQADSLVLWQLSAMAFQSTLPPASISLTSSKSPAPLHTELRATEPLNENVTNVYEVRALPLTAAKTDTGSVVGTFKAKISQLKIFTTSAGLAYTIMQPHYGINSFDESKSEIKTDREAVSVIAGIHVHLARIDMLEERWTKENCLSHFSVYLGFDIPNITKHVYPGLSVDVIPGIKLIGGAHFYRHDLFDIRNNKVVDKDTKIRCAGPFMSVAIDPTIALKAFGILK
ncbi:hypothetical protein MKQ68_09725 [Chitinophaga horti]|uniref:Uncharacterized protein n=1 Tax=Chitinophaga horti TaxID=2920382 RepID=A0ABY6J6S5_9BACT|nr:hypothetical protein [Chitinophaga horti]UYQ95375.1 hypothetical protein MKQ68_09725 [Chitinophaga horti]